MFVKSLLSALALSTALVFPGLVQARPVTLTVNMSNYGGDGTYLAVYVTDPAGAYAGSLWMSGGKAKYYKHLSDWARLTGQNTAEVDGITGASIGAGRSLELSMDLADALFDAGYTLHIDAAVEDMRDSPNEIELPLTNAGAAAKGRTYISQAAYGF